MRAPKRESRSRATCAECKKPFTKFTPAQKYCDKHRPAYRPVLKSSKQCDYCGQPFDGRKGSKFCSKEHRLAYWKNVYSAGKTAWDAAKTNAVTKPLKKKESKK